MKQERCCTRLSSRVSAAKAELARVARLEAYHSQQGHNVSRFPALIQAKKAEVATNEAALVDHEAEHAGERVEIGDGQQMPKSFLHTPSMDISDRWYQR